MRIAGLVIIIVSLLGTAAYGDLDRPSYNSNAYGFQVKSSTGGSTLLGMGLFSNNGRYCLDASWGLTPYADNDNTINTTTLAFMIGFSRYFLDLDREDASWLAGVGFSYVEQESGGGQVYGYTGYLGRAWTLSDTSYFQAELGGTYWDRSKEIIVPTETTWPGVYVALSFNWYMSIY